MNFASISFLFYFLPIVVGAYFLLRHRALRNLWLLAVSLLFYAWGEGLGISLLIISIAINHVFATLIHRRLNGRAVSLSAAVPVSSRHSGSPALAGGTESRSGVNLLLSVGVSVNILILIIFKYLGLLTETVGLARVETSLPLGISFFTFQAISMLIDVARGEEPSSSPIKTGLYISMFPQLIAGPIVRWTEINHQIDHRTESWDRFSAGMHLFVLGLAQKVLLADTLAVPADAAFGLDPSSLTTASAWIGISAFTLQIFYDFAGYSNMAIGIGRMFGFELPRNFEHPYSSASFQEFWRRWHMTLSRWFRDYLYIPLGGSRGGRVSTYRNLLIVFVLCGIWHGASWTFLLWGLWHGAFLIFERLGREYGFPELPRFVGVIYTLVFVMFGWVLFRAESLEAALGYWGAMLGIESGDASVKISSVQLLAFFVGAMLAWDRWKNMLDRRHAEPSDGVQAITWVGVVGLAALSLIAVAATTQQPFLYFRF